MLRCHFSPLLTVHALFGAPLVPPPEHFVNSIRSAAGPQGRGLRSELRLGQLLTTSPQIDKVRAKAYSSRRSCRAQVRPACRPGRSIVDCGHEPGMSVSDDVFAVPSPEQRTRRRSIRPSMGRLRVVLLMARYLPSSTGPTRRLSAHWCLSRWSPPMTQSWSRSHVGVMSAAWAGIPTRQM